MRYSLRSAIALTVALVFGASACGDPPTATVGPVDDLHIVVDTSEAELVTSVDLALRLKCLTTIPDLFIPGARGYPYSIPLDVSHRREGDLLHLRASTGRRYMATSPPKEHLFAKHYCKAFARMFVRYPGASPIKTRVPGGGLADSYFTTELGLVGPVGSGTHDFTAQLVEGVGGKYKIRCKYAGTRAGKPADTLELLKWSEARASWESQGGSLLGGLDRPCVEDE